MFGLYRFLRLVCALGPVLAHASSHRFKGLPRSGRHSRILPKVKRDNSTCCGYLVTNHDAYFRHQSIIDFSAVCSIDRSAVIVAHSCSPQLKSMDAVYQAGWDIAQGSWRVGAVNANTGQYAKGYEITSS